jgi:peptide/nickel transport system ATP-binding protein
MNLLELDDEEMRSMRWSRISLIPQGAMNSLNPVMRIKDQIGDAITTHGGAISSEELDARVRELLTMMSLSSTVADMYPHELSGGMKQRVCIAMATALSPQLILADEPTSALDVVVQRVVMQMLIDVQEDLGASLILVGHDMGLIAQAVDRLAIMYAGKVAEVGDVRPIFKDPLHPYTQLLISSLPSPREKRRRQVIPGLPPALIDPPPGCLFHPRCPQMIDLCPQEAPLLREVRPGRLVACHLYN